jgi:hypothetical protein
MHYLGICLEELGETTNDLSQDSRSSDRYLNPGTLEYEAGVLTVLSRRSVFLLSKCLHVDCCEVTEELSQKTEPVYVQFSRHLVNNLTVKYSCN